MTVPVKPTKLERLQQRLENAYDAEQRALKEQTTSNAEGEQSSIANLKDIRALINDLENQIELLEGTDSTPNAHLFWTL